MKIVSLTVVDDQGVTHKWEGTEGFVSVTTAQKKSESQLTGSAKQYGVAVDAHLIVPKP